jgi:PASTA domain
MTEDNPFELPEKAGDREMDAGARQRRWGRGLVVTVASAAVVVTVIGGSALVSALRNSAEPGPPVASASPLVTPPGTRLVGAGHAAIAVPEEWGTNKALCGVPQQDTVVIDVAAVEACLPRRPRGVDSVDISEGPPSGPDHHVDATTEIDGVPAERQNTTCSPDLGGRPVCTGTIYFRSLGVGFGAASSTSRAEVDRILSWIRIVPDLVGVPGFDKINVDAQITDLQGGARAIYVDALTRAGLTAQIHTRTVHASPTGYILAVSPVPGTMVRPGTVVTVTVVAEPRGPADEVDVGISSVHWPEEVYQDLSDAQIRAGATIELEVGDQIWAYASGKRARTLAGQLDGTSLAVENPNYPPRWVAASEGTTKITLTITADGEPVVLGTVTVVVR